MSAEIFQMRKKTPKTSPPPKISLPLYPPPPPSLPNTQKTNFIWNFTGKSVSQRNSSLTCKGPHSVTKLISKTCQWDKHSKSVMTLSWRIKAWLEHCRPRAVLSSIEPPCSKANSIKIHPYCQCTSTTCRLHSRDFQCPLSTLPAVTSFPP